MGRRGWCGGPGRSARQPELLAADPSLVPPEPSPGVSEPKHGEGQHGDRQGDYVGGLDRSERGEQDEQQDDHRAEAPEQVKRSPQPRVLVGLEMREV
jgi:hypothetical protein